MRAIEDISIHTRIERGKARALRKTAWWQRKTAPGNCYYCQKSFKIIDLCMDHKQPLSAGGFSTKGNIVPACKPCNTRKRNLTPIEWQEYMEKTTDNSYS